MILEFLPGALRYYMGLKRSIPELAEKVKLYVSDIMIHPESGMGEPIELEGDYKGIWHRKLSFETAMYYTFDRKKVIVLAIVGQHHNEELNSNLKSVNLQSFSQEEYEAVLAQMKANRGKDTEPKVGIFWYNAARNELFGIVSHRISDYTEVNASEGRITCSEMHEDVWKREYRRRKYHGDDMGPYVGAYQDKPRGRIFYRIETDTFEVAIGKWLEKYPQAYDLILEEFDLPPEKTSAKYAIHWDIGMSWR